MTLSAKERALNKTRIEINKDISLLIDMAKHCGLGEIQYFVYYLHVIRLLPRFGNIPKGKNEMVGLYVRQFDEAYKYIIQIITKYGQNKYIKNDLNNTILNLELVQLMLKAALGINAKFESLSFLSMFNNIEVKGQRDQHIKINMEEVMKDPRLSKFYEYSLRVDRENDFKKDNPYTAKALLIYFKEEYNAYSDLFLKEFKLTLDNFIELIDWIVHLITTQIQIGEKKCSKLENGNININSFETFILVGSAFFVEKNKVFEHFSFKAKPILERLTFKPDLFDQNQLSYNLIARKPIIEKSNSFIISPELLLDSLFINSHYSLLETSELKDEYKKRFSNSFVDQILEKCIQNGYEEFAKGLELFEGKNQLGDLDLVVKNNNNEFLLIEAKNHSLPMDVYFHDFEATEKRLTQLLDEWEKKVKRRHKHLELKHQNYGISNAFKYIIVSKAPEIISHFSEYLILSLNEFDYWITTKNLNTTFSDVLKGFYKIDESKFTIKQLRQIEKDLSTGWSFKKK